MQNYAFWFGICLLLFVFIYTGISKISDYDGFYIKITKSPLLFDYARPISILVPFLEILTVLFLLVTKLRTVGLLLSGFLMFMFTSYLTVLFLFYENIPCGCSGVFSFLSYSEHLIVNIVLCCISIYCYVFDADGSKEDNEKSNVIRSANVENSHPTETLS